MSIYSYDALLSKSKVFIAKGIQRRHDGDYGEFQLWAAMSLELLGKAALAKVHPALVADPNHLDSLFTACGHPIGTDRKSIMARTVFERLKHLSSKFDKLSQEFCLEMANRRNAELHSGDLPYAAMRPEAWVPKFWQITAIILDAQRLTLEDWIGVEEASGAAAIVSNALTAVEQAVRARIDRHRIDFEGKYHPGSAAHDATMREISLTPATLTPLFGRLAGDQQVEHICPACICVGAVSGEYWNEELLDTTDPDEPWIEYVQITYSTLAFRCRGCGLRLDGREELSVAGIPEQFEKEEVREPDYEPDYGNC